MTSTATTPRRPFRNPLYVLYFVGALGYLLYGVFTKTGLYGWLLDLQLGWFNSASERLTIGLATLLLILPPLLVAARFGRASAVEASAPASAGSSFRTLA